MRSSEARATSPPEGVPVQRRFSARKARNPNPISTSSGTSFAAVRTVLKRLAPRTPRTLRPARSAKTTRITALLAFADASAGTSAAMESAKNEDTAASGEVSPTQSRTPVTKPTSGPKATSTYAYTPPVSETRLAASAKQRTTSAMAAAQTR